MTTTIISSSAEIIDFTAVKATMPFEAIKELWQKQVVADKSLSGGTVKVALALCWHMNRSQHGLAWPGFTLLAKLTGLHRRTIIRTTQALERAGHVTITRSRRGTTNNPNQYRPMLKQVGPECHHPSGTDVTTPSDMDVTRTSEDNLRDNLYLNKAARSLRGGQKY